MNTDDIPIARIIENPKSIVKITIKNMPPPMPSNPEKNPTKRPVNIIAKKLKSNLASFSFLSLESKFLIAINKSKHPKIISKILEGASEATNPPIKLPKIPKIPNLIITAPDYLRFTFFSIRYEVAKNAPITSSMQKMKPAISIFSSPSTGCAYWSNSRRVPSSEKAT